MSDLEILVPTKPETVLDEVASAPRPLLGDRVRLTLIANGKPNARELLELMAEELASSLPPLDIAVVVKRGASMTLSESELRAIADTSDLAIAALGDCGACSACSLHDAISLERMGLPTTVVITDVFVRTAADFARSLGMPGFATVVVPHPVSTRDRDHLRGMAADAAPAARRLLAPGTLALVR